MIMKKVTYCGPGMLRALGLRAGQSRVVSRDRLTPALLQRYRQHLVIQDARTRIAEFVGHAVPKKHLVTSRAQVIGSTERQAAPDAPRREAPKPVVEVAPEPVAEVIEIVTEPSEIIEAMLDVDLEIPAEPVASLVELPENWEELSRKKLLPFAEALNLEPARSKKELVAQIKEAVAE